MTKFENFRGCFVPPPTTQNLRQLPCIAIKATLSFSTSLVATDTVEVIQTFEPQVNTPALSAFLIIAIVFSLLQFRINSVRDASERRNEALNNLRQVKAAQLGDGDLSKRPTDAEVDKAVSAYKFSLEEELTLRTIIPGVRIVAPSDPTRTEADVAAAKQFLGLDLEADELVVANGDEGAVIDRGQRKTKNLSRESKDNLLLQPRRRFDGKSGTKVSKEIEEEEGLSNGAKAILLVVAVSQIALLIFLSFDPMTADSVFTTIGGSPPTDFPAR